MSVDVTRDPGKPAPGMYTAVDHKWIGLQMALLLSVMISLGACLAAQSAFGGGIYHGYFFLLVVWVANICNDMPALYCCLVTLVWTICYFGMIVNNDTQVEAGSSMAYVNGNKWVSSLMTFFCEKYLPVVILAVLAGRKLERQTRFQFSKQLSHRDTMRTAKIEEKKNFELVPLPPAIRELMRKSTSDGSETRIVIDAFGSVLFADIVSFTVYSTDMDPMNLVLVLNEMFSMHDTLATRMGVDKIKTLGDCYVAATGLLAPTPNHASLLVKFGIGMHDIMDKLNTKFDIHGNGPAGKDLRIRVGIATGTVVGGVVGLKKFLFDIWGDTVEQAETMESEGVPERVHVSDTTYERASKDEDLRFTPDDKSRHSGGQIDGYTGQSWLAVIPGKVKGCEQTIQQWIDELFPIKNDEDDNATDERSKGKKRSDSSYNDSQERKREQEQERATERFGEERFGEIVDEGVVDMSNPMHDDEHKHDNGSTCERVGSTPNAHHQRLSHGEVHLKNTMTRTPSMRAMIEGNEEPKFEGIPEVHSNSNSRKNNAERIKKYVGGGGKVWLWCVFFCCRLADHFSFVVVVVVVVVVLSDEGSTVLLFTVAHPRRLALVPHQ